VGELLCLRLQGSLRVFSLKGSRTSDPLLARRVGPRHRPARLGPVVVGSAGVRFGAGGAGRARRGGGGDARGRGDVRGELREVKAPLFFFLVFEGSSEGKNSKTHSLPFSLSLSLFLPGKKNFSQVRRHRVRRDGPGSFGHG